MINWIKKGAPTWNDRLVVISWGAVISVAIKVLIGLLKMTGGGTLEVTKLRGIDLLIVTVIIAVLQEAAFRLLPLSLAKRLTTGQKLGIGAGIAILLMLL